MNPIRVLIADDAVVVRRILTIVIDEDPDLEVVGVAANGAIALQKVAHLKPDIITLDVEMPEMDGLQALRELRKTNRDLPVIMFSTLTERGAAATLEALSLGASDYVTKPANVGSVNAAIDSVRRELIPRIKSLCKRGLGPDAGGAARVSPASGGAGVRTVRPAGSPPVARAANVTAPTGRVELVAIGSSTGGPVALATVLGALPASLRVPVVVTQHMPPVFTRLLAERLNGSMAITVREAQQGDVLAPGTVYIAPGDFHMAFKRGARGIVVDLNQQPQVNYCRPAVDVMYDSIVTHFGGDVLAVILTGMGHDGRDGCAALKQRGATVFAQNEATSVVWGMPGAVANAGLADRILAIGDVGPSIVTAVNAGRRTSQVA